MMVVVCRDRQLSVLTAVVATTVGISSLIVHTDFIQAQNGTLPNCPAGRADGGPAALD